MDFLFTLMLASFLAKQSIQFATILALYIQQFSRAALRGFINKMRDFANRIDRCAKAAYEKSNTVCSMRVPWADLSSEWQEYWKLVAKIVLETV